MFTTLPRYIQLSMIVGVLLGMLLTAFMFMNVQWYHDLLVWSWTTPWLVLPGLATGAVLAIIFDD